MALDEAPPNSSSNRFESPSQSSASTRFAVSSKRPYGGVAQLVERFGRIEEARGSIPPHLHAIQKDSVAQSHWRTSVNSADVCVPHKRLC